MEKNKIEKEELHHLKEKILSYDRLHVKEGQIEPTYLDIEERNLITDEMKGSLEKIAEDIFQNLWTVN